LGQKLVISNKITLDEETVSTDFIAAAALAAAIKEAQQTPVAKSENSNGIKNGPWQETKGGSKAVVNYKNGKKLKKIPSLGSQIAACWMRDAGSQAEQVKLTVIMALDRSGRVSSNSIQVLEISGGNQAAQKVAFQRVKRAILICGIDGYKVSKDMLGQKVKIVFDPTN